MLNGFGTVPWMTFSRSPRLPFERDRVEQALGVRVLRGEQDLVDGALLDDPAGVHDDDVVDRLGHDAEVVGDQQQRRPGPVLDLPEELEDLGLDRDVERRRRLVGDQQLRVARQRHRDHDALAHAARHLVRVLLDPALRGRDARPPRATRSRVSQACLLRLTSGGDDRLGDLVADA